MRRASGTPSGQGAAARGVTYVELLVVATVAGILATLILPTGLTMWRAWKERQLRRALVQIRVALDEYHHDWERGCVEATTEKGWPESLEELAQPIELTDLPQCQPGGESGQGGAALPIASDDDDDGEKAPPTTKQYLRAVPKDPFNEEGEEFDVSGWKARSYDDDWDSTSWGGDDVYDVRSSSSLVSLSGTRYEEW